ncbi:unnamed protein product [Urochloa decumbens]|uniref:Uncharacterized protein n=1 Tax=Urochloa decumbens TaxID=240449 RepID=A0ABC9DL56_9POAL
MADQGERLPPDHLVRHAGVLDAARVLMLLGGAAAVSATVGSPGGGNVDAWQVFLVLVIWLLGVCLLSAAARFPQADALADAAVASASAVIRRLFTPWKLD